MGYASMIDAVTLLQRLVRTPSVNPRLTSDPSISGEARPAPIIADLLRNAGFAVELPEVLPGRPNVVAYRPGVTKDAVGFCAHLDTMPPDGMTVPPFAAEIRDGRLWGRGAADTKAALAAMLAAVVNAVESDAQALPSILFLGTCDEEAGFAGAKHFARNPHPPLLGMVIGEPTGLQLVTAHKGVLRCEVRTSGRAAHASTPDQGENAIYRMAEVVRGLERLALQLTARPPHPLLGPPTLVVGTIRGGTAVNTVPDSCVVQLDRRLLPGESPEAALAEIRTAVAGAPGAVLEDPFLAVPGMEIPADHPWRRLVSTAVGASRDIGVPYATDASILSAAGVPCTVLGPGSPKAAHTADEHVAIEQVQRAVEIYEAVLYTATRQ